MVKNTISEINTSPEDQDVKPNFEYQEINSEESPLINNNNDNSLNIRDFINPILAGETLPTANYFLLKTSLITIISLLGVTAYFDAAAKFGAEHDGHYAGDTVTEREINYILGIAVTGVGLLYLSLSHFLLAKRNNSIAKEFSKFLDIPESNFKSRAQDFFIVLGSAFSAIPLMLMTLFYPLPIPFALLVVLAAIVQVVNSLLHFFPIYLAFQKPIYRLPFLPFEMIGKLIYQRLCQDRKLKEIDKLTSSLPLVLMHISGEVYHEYSAKLRNRNHSPRMSSTLKDQILGIQPTDDLFAALCEAFLPSKNLHLNKQEASCASNVLERISKLTFASYYVLSCIGYLKLPIDAFYSLTKNIALTIVASASADWWLTVLLTFFGNDAGSRFYHWLTDWGPKSQKLFLEFLLYPKTFIFYELVMAYPIFYNYGAGAEIFLGGFKDEMWDDVRPYLYWICISGITLLAIDTMKGAFQMALREWAMQYGNNDAKAAIRLTEAINHLCYLSQFLKQEVLASPKNQEYLEQRGVTIITSRQLVAETDSSMKQSCCGKLPFWKSVSRKQDISRTPRNAEEGESQSLLSSKHNSSRGYGL